MKNILVLSCEEDPHADSVCKYFDSNEINYFRVNTNKLIENYSITFNSKLELYEISDSKDTILLDESWNIWNRRIAEPELPKDFPEELENIVFTETEKTLEGLLLIHKGKVVNKPNNSFAANNKIDQLMFVKNYGIKIPNTVLTSNPQKLLKFYHSHKPICHKLQRVAVVERDGDYFVTYNNLVTEDNLSQAELIKLHPTLFQKYINKEYELRITALENKVIGIAIHSQDSEISKIDFRRYDFENVKYEVVDLPKNITKFCKDILTHYSLSFGEIDMIYTKNKEYVFLEINPNGQWLWLELKTSYNLTKDIAENLIN